MSRKRSPRYPSIALPEAIDGARMIYQKEHTNPMDRETAVKSMGHSSLNGASARKLASLIAFGLLEGREDNITITEDAVTILADEHSEDQSERVEALMRCLTSSQLFQDLSERYPKAPSVPNIASFLMKNGFKPDAAQLAAKTYKESVAFVEIAMGEYNQRTESGIGGSPEISDTAIDRVVTKPTMADSAPGKELAGAGDNMRQETFALDTGNVTIQWPSHMTQESFEDFSDWLDILKRKVRRSVDSGPKDQYGPEE